MENALTEAELRLWRAKVAACREASPGKERARG
jgi:hypothetical protein